MMLDLQAITDFPARITLEEDNSRLDISADGLSLIGNVRTELTIVRSDNIHYCTGEAACEAKIECSRCLEAYTMQLRGELDFLIREAGDETNSGQDEVGDNEIIIAAGAPRVDITAPVREALLLEVPLKPLCAEDCRGLCPHCGVNRNETKCDCRHEESDSRWDALRDRR